MAVIEVKRLKIDSNLRGFILERDRYTCRYCGSTTPPFHLDHVYPVAKGGETTPNNLVTACRKCNAEKHTSIVFPMPIGYFDNNNDPKVFLPNIIICAFGISAVLNGMWNIYEYVVYGTFSMLLGAIILGILLIRLSTGRN